jgi:hypothetical protein
MSLSLDPVAKGQIFARGPSTFLQPPVSGYARRRQRMERLPNKVHGFSTDFAAEFCLCMPFGAERNKALPAKTRRNPGNNGGRDRD